jgi:hypothetical protein
MARIFTRIFTIHGELLIIFNIINVQFHVIRRPSLIRIREHKPMALRYSDDPLSGQSQAFSPGGTLLAYCSLIQLYTQLVAATLWIAVREVLGSNLDHVQAFLCIVTVFLAILV